MSKKIAVDRRMVSWQLPIATLDAIILLSEQNRRNVWEEVAHALERHLTRPPQTVTVTPELEVAEMEVQATPKKRRGRPPKCTKTAQAKK